jgi:hypothetical protein
MNGRPFFLRGRGGFVRDFVGPIADLAKCGGRNSLDFVRPPRSRPEILWPADI